MENHNRLYRLVTRNDMNGLACAALLYYLNLIDDVAFVHPREIESGKFQLTENDISANLPYVTTVHLAFQHRIAGSDQSTLQHPNRIIDTKAESAARVIYNYYGGGEKISSLLGMAVASADKANSARYTIEEVLHPKDWDLLSFVLDPQTGLGRFKDFQLSTDSLIKLLARLCATTTIEDILIRPEIKERKDLYLEQEVSFDEQIERCSSEHGKLLVIDLRGEAILFAGNRFKVYALYPKTSISMQVNWGSDEHKTVLISVGKSIFDRSSKVDVGMIMKQFGGGGHSNAGSTQIDINDYTKFRENLIHQLTSE